MKLSPHRNFPRLGKWVPFFQQEKRTVDDIDYKEIDATELQEICALMAPSGFDSTDSYIKKAGLEENIVLETDLDYSPDNPKIKSVIFRNLKIKGEVDIRFSALERIEFTNSEFSDNVNIIAMDATDATVFFKGNKFSKNFCLVIRDVYFALIINNDVLEEMRVRFGFTPPPNDSDKYKIKKEFGDTRSAELLMNFLKNKINALLIVGGTGLFDWHKQEYPFEKITFDGGNRIRTLNINTKYTVLTFYRQLKVNINLISFGESDKIGVPTPKTKVTSDGILRPFFTVDNSYQLYGRFFSLLEAQAFEQHDRITKEIYNRKVRYFNKKLSASREDRVIFDWTNLISKDGTSWIRPLQLLIAVQTLLAIITYYLFAGYDPDLGEMCVPYFDKALTSDLKECTPYLDKGLIPFLGLFAWFMNPVSLLPPIKITMASGGIYIIFLFQKIFSALFYYEIVKVLRRFSR